MLAIPSRAGLRLAWITLAAVAGLLTAQAAMSAQPLTVTCQGDLTVECNGHNGTVLNYPANHCRAQGGQGAATLTYSPASGTAFPMGTTTVTVTATDRSGATAQDTFNVIVQDTTPPVVRFNTQVTSMWPANHRLINVGFRGTVRDACDPNPVVTIQVFSDEEDEVPTGDGNFSPDAKPGHSFAPNLLPLRLRTERSGGGDGRVYLILVTATDSSGNVGHACGTVVVPHSQSSAAKRSVQSQAAAALAHCARTRTAPAGFVPVGDGPIIGRIQ